MIEEWGSVAGDLNADGIIRDRRSLKRWLGWTNFGFLVAAIAVAIWYAISGSHVALALEVFLSANLAAGWAQHGSYDTHTFVMIAERRAQLLEHHVQHLDERLGVLIRQMDHRL